MDLENIYQEFLKYISSFIGKTTNEIFNMFNFDSNAKSKNYLVVTKIVESFQGKPMYELLKANNNLKLKTIQLTNSGKPKEAMSFAPINYCELVNEVRESSSLKEYLQSKFIFFVFKMNDKDENYLNNIIVWEMPYNDLEGEIKKTWLEVKKILENGEVIKSFEINGKVKTNFPSEARTHICHVRPHARNGKDVIKLPVTDKVTGYNYMSKYSFWFNHEYLNRIINEFKGLRGV